MKAIRFCLLTAILATSLFMASLADESTSMSDEADDQAIRAVVDQYFRGVVNADRELLEGAWHAARGVQMQYVKSLGVREPEFESVPIDVAIEWWTRVKAKSSSGKVLSVDIVEGEMALVKFDFRYEHMQFIDYLTLMKIKGEWKLVNKSYYRIMPERKADKPERGEK